MDKFDDSILEASLDNYEVNLWHESMLIFIYLYIILDYVGNIIVQIINAFPRSHKNTSTQLMPKFYMETQILLLMIIDNNNCDGVN